MGFWDRVAGCKHENLYPNYSASVACGTPYCSGHEYHCKDCGVFIADCGCGFVRGLSGWPEARWRKLRRKKYYKIKEGGEG